MRYGVGVDHIDLDAASEHGVLVCNVPDYGVEEVSDHALTLTVALLRRVVLLDRLVHRGVWDVSQSGPVPRFRGLNLGIVGLGRIGLALARKARALGFRVLAHDPHQPPDRFLNAEAESVELQALLERSDAVSLHVPLSDLTRHLIGAGELARLKPGSVLVNTARGALLDEAALLEALSTGRLAGVALDVLEREPIEPNHPLLKFDNVILTPHAAWFSTESAVRLKRFAAEEVLRILSGEQPRCPLNPQAWNPDGRER